MFGVCAYRLLSVKLCKDLERSASALNNEGRRCEGHTIDLGDGAKSSDVEGDVPSDPACRLIESE